jgi:hypothetical protein
MRCCEDWEGVKAPCRGESKLQVMTIHIDSYNVVHIYTCEVPLRPVRYSQGGVAEMRGALARGCFFR